jgi:hypothetical protein
MNWPSLTERVPAAPDEYAAKLGRSLRVIQRKALGTTARRLRACCLSA